VDGWVKGPYRKNIFVENMSLILHSEDNMILCIFSAVSVKVWLFVWNNYAIVIVMSSRRQINIVSENVQLCIFTYSRFHSKTFYMSLI